MGSNSWTVFWTPVSSDNLSGWVSSVEEAEKVRKAFEVQTSLCFVSSKKQSLFGLHTSECCIFYNLLVVLD